MLVPTPGRRLKQLMESGIVALPGAYNAITAKLVVEAGFEAAYVSGAGITNALTGLPDIGLISLEEMARQTRYICNAVNIPVIADADTGYGDIHNVVRTVQEMEASGLAGIHIEDQLSPKRCGHLDGKQLIPASEMARKIAAAVQSRRDPDFLIIARTDARGVTSFDDAVNRANCYLAAGADAIFPEALQDENEFADFAKRVNAPLLANMTEFGKSPLLTVQQLEQIGYKMVIFPMTQFRIEMKAGLTALQHVRHYGTQANLLDQMQTRAELYELIEYPAFQKMDETFGNLA